MTVQTRYMQSAQQTINGLTAYTLATTQSASALSVSSIASSVVLNATLYPTSTVLAGFPNQYPVTGLHHDKVDDPAGSPDDESTYVYTGDSTTRIYDRYEHTAYAGPSTIAYVKVTCRGWRDGIGTRVSTLRYGFYIGTTYYTASFTGTVDAWVTQTHIWYTNPATGLPWTPTDITNLQLALYGVSKLYLEAYYYARCTQVFMQVYTYTDVVITYAIDIVKRTSEGTETNIGTKVAQQSNLLSSLYSSSGLKSATWICPQTDLESTDSIVVRVYQKVGAGAWNLVREFTTEQLGALSLDSATWTVYYYLSASADASYMYSVFWHGTSVYNSCIENFTWTPAPVVGIASKRLLVGVGL